MSNPNLPDLIMDPNSDLTESDLTAIQEYKDKGLPGIATVDEAKLTRIMDLYLSGKTYRQISKIARVEKSLILYLSDKFNWYLMKREYFEDLEKHIQGRLIEAKLVNQDFLLQLIHMWQKKIGAKIADYLANGNEASASSIDLKEVDKYLKTVAMLHQLGANKGEQPTTPAVGLNLGDGVTIERKGDNTVEITPKQQKIGDMLKQFADSRRIEEKDPKKN